MIDVFKHDDPSLLHLTASVVASFVSYNSVQAGELAALVSSVRRTFRDLNGLSQPEAPTQKPAIAINKSITPDLIYCLETGKGYRLLRRHLWTAFRMTPEQYRQKWKLPADYPMVAPGYSATRSALAIAAGLGEIGRTSRAGKRKRDSKLRG
jgi:predicted transcriptional regulator